MLSPGLVATIHQRVTQVLAGHPEGLDRMSLQEMAGLNALGVQTVRRLLAKMEALGLLRAEGQTRKRRYFPATQGLGGGKGAPSSEAAEASLLLSEEGKACRVLVNRPLLQRDHVGYRREFLDRYVPNGTFYLTESMRRTLWGWGGGRNSREPAGTFARRIFQRLIIDLSWNSSRLEGNTYSLLDTERLVQLGHEAEGKDHQETQMILNHKAAIEYLVEAAESIAPDPATLRNLHAMLLDDLMDNRVDAGRVRTGMVGIHGTSYVPLEAPHVLDECFRHMLRLAGEIQDPFEQAFFLLVHVPYLQPFMDGNKRTARMAANIPFIRANCIPITFTEVPRDLFVDGMLAIYEANRVELLRDIFLFAYERSCQRFGALRTSMGQPDPFRLRYRQEIKALVQDIVLALEDLPAAEPRVRAFLDAHVPAEAQARFRTVVETELASLHDGNYARFRLRPSEYEAWARFRKEREPGGQG